MDSCYSSLGRLQALVLGRAVPNVGLCRGRGPCCPSGLYPCPWVVGTVSVVPVAATPFVSLALSFVAAALTVGPGALDAFLVPVVVVCCPLLLPGGLHEGVIDGRQVCHELVGDGVESLRLSHSHGDIPCKRLPQRLDLGKFGGVSANQGDPPIAIFVDCFLGAKLDEDPGPAHCIDAVLDHVEAPDSYSTHNMSDLCTIW